ncbi:MAG: hypothetical protein AAGI90_03760 [Chlamydiota bacterium]
MGECLELIVIKWISVYVVLYLQAEFLGSRTARRLIERTCGNMLNHNHLHRSLGCFYDFGRYQLFVTLSKNSSSLPNFTKVPPSRLKSCMSIGGYKSEKAALLITFGYSKEHKLGCNQFVIDLK